MSERRKQVRALNAARRTAVRRVQRADDAEDMENWNAVCGHLDNERDRLRPRWQRTIMGVAGDE